MRLKWFCVCLFTILWYIPASAQNLMVDFPTETTESISNWQIENPDLPFKLFWKAKSGQYVNVNESAKSKTKIVQYQLYYSFVQAPTRSTDFIPLPLYFSTKYPVKFKQIQTGIWQIWFIGLNKRVFNSTVMVYQTASWMKDILHPLQSKKTLKDIVIPGSHDAGMSVLTATGGQQKGTINACNTLTQQLSIQQQLMQGIRMFDLRVGTYNNMLYTKHAAADCMVDAIGGGYGESLKTVSLAIKQFLKSHSEEIVLVSFSHFCESETPIKQLQDSLLYWIGQETIYQNHNASIGDISLSQLAGKVVLSFEIPNWKVPSFPNCSIADSASSFINFRRAYASTNQLSKLIQTEADFFVKLQSGVKQNDLIRLDWQITQSADEASAVCNDFQDEHLNPLVNGAILLANMIRKNKSIIDHAKIANQQLPVQMRNWLLNQTINQQNKPNIIYVDDAGAWATDFTISFLRTNLY
jgi:hypothetical protein